MFYQVSGQSIDSYGRVVSVSGSVTITLGVPSAAPSNDVLPSITGMAEIGQMLSVSTGTWSNFPTAYTYQWKRDGIDIGGATSNTYTIPSTTGGLSCYVTASNVLGSTTVRADSGEPRQLFLCGDSLTSPEAYSTALQDALDGEFGAGAWLVNNTAVSAYDIPFMETRTQTAVDPYVDAGHGIVFFHEYANQVSGIFGADSGATVATKLFTFGENRVAEGGLPLYCTSPYNGAQTGGHNGDQAHVASETVRADYADHGGVGLVDFDNATLLANINSNDGVHWTSAVYDLCASLTVDGIVAAGLTGGCGDIRIYAPVFTNLRTWTASALFVYDPVNPLPYPVVDTQIQVTAGSGWNLVTHTIGAAFSHWNVEVDGYQTIYQISPAQSAPALTGGTYTLS